jgi:predicted peptidase
LAVTLDCTSCQFVADTRILAQYHSIMSLENPQTAGIHSLVRPDGRRYTLAIPKGYDGQTSRPLIITLHYGGPVSPFYGQGLLVGVIEPALRRLGALLVAPDCNHGRWDNEPSEIEVLELADYLAEHYPLDSSRSLLTGYSLGGIGAWYIAGRNQESFAAALPMGANPPAGLLATSWHLPVYAIHGREDELFPWQATADAINDLLERGVPAELILLDGVTHFETGRFMRPLQGAIPWIKQVWDE